MENVLGTGSCAFIGSNLLQMALQRLYELDAGYGYGITIEQVVPAIRSLLGRNKA